MPLLPSVAKSVQLPHAALTRSVCRERSEFLVLALRVRQPSTDLDELIPATFQAQLNIIFFITDNNLSSNNNSTTDYYDFQLLTDRRIFWAERFPLDLGRSLWIVKDIFFTEWMA